MCGAYDFKVNNRQTAATTNQFEDSWAHHWMGKQVAIKCGRAGGVGGGAHNRSPNMIPRVEFFHQLQDLRPSNVPLL